MPELESICWGRLSLFRRMDKIYHAAENILAQLKVVEESSPNEMMNTTDRDEGKAKHREGSSDPQWSWECWNYGRRHNLLKRELCPAYGIRCSKCHKMNHFAVKCSSGWSSPVCPVTSTEDVLIGASKEIFQAHTTYTSLDDSQLVTLRLESGNHFRFQVDTGVIKF